MNNEFSYLSAISDYMIFVFLALWGGTANFIRKRKLSEKPFNLRELCAEWVISGFAGVITVLACKEFGASPLVTAAAAGIAGHAGATSIVFFEQIFKSVLRSYR